MLSRQIHENLIDEFIVAQVVNRELDERTIKAYRLDLELFFRWLTEEKTDFETTEKEEQMEIYLEYLSKEKKLRFSTICRKYLVLGYYLSFLKEQGVISDFRPLKSPAQPKEASVDIFLTKKEVDEFFQAINREYTDLDSDFRKRVCLRDQVMMKLLFYHGIEISELLRLETSDYNQKTAVLMIHRKKERDRVVHLFSKILQEQMARWLDEHEYFEHGDVYQNRLFLSKLGRPLSMKMVTNIFDKYRVMAGIEKECTPKDLKNSLGRYGEELVRERIK